MERVDGRVIRVRQDSTVPPARCACGTQPEIDLGGIGSRSPGLRLPASLGSGPLESDLDLALESGCRIIPN